MHQALTCMDVIQLRRCELPPNSLSIKTDNISCPRTNRLRTRGVMALWRPLYRVAWCLPSYTWDPCPGVTARPYRECSDPLSPSKLKSPTINISWCSQLSLNALFNGCVKLLDEPSVWSPLLLLMFLLLLLLMLLLPLLLLLMLLLPWPDDEWWLCWRLGTILNYSVFILIITT